MLSLVFCLDLPVKRGSCGEIPSFNRAGIVSRPRKRAATWVNSPLFLFRKPRSVGTIRDLGRRGNVHVCALMAAHLAALLSLFAQFESCGMTCFSPFSSSR
jgi:hypothetical protein